ncbi:conserved protein, unknown function, partial [Hepatocystis sp. ex Piliocolobus tephrosceles]
NKMQNTGVHEEPENISNKSIEKMLEGNNDLSNINNHLQNYQIKNVNTNKNNEILKTNETGKEVENKNTPNISNNNMIIPRVIKKMYNVKHKNEIIPYFYTLVLYNNYNIFFISHNGKFASWVYTYNDTLPYDVKQESQIVLGERDYPFLEIFCSKFMKDHALLLNNKPIMFAISIYKMCFDDIQILKNIYTNLSNMIRTCL